MTTYLGACKRKALDRLFKGSDPLIVLDDFLQDLRRKSETVRHPCHVAAEREAEAGHMDSRESVHKWIDSIDDGEFATELVQPDPEPSVQPDTEPEPEPEPEESAKPRRRRSRLL